MCGSGGKDVAERTDLFLAVVANIITSRAKDIDYVDMRYGNGFTIGWKDGASRRSLQQSAATANRRLPHCEDNH